MTQPTDPKPVAGRYSEADRYRMDGAALLGAAAHLLKALTDPTDQTGAIVRNMARDWSDAYARYQNSERARLPWSVDFWWEG